MIRSGRRVSLLPEGWTARAVPERSGRSRAFEEVVEAAGTCELFEPWGKLAHQGDATRRSNLLDQGE